MTKVRLNQWAKENKLRSSDVIRTLKSQGYRVNGVTEKFEPEVLYDVIFGEQIRIKRQKNIEKKNRYRTNLYEDRINRELFSIDDIFDELDVSYEISEEIKRAIGLNVSKLYKRKKGFNGSHLINLYSNEYKTVIMDYIKETI